MSARKKKIIFFPTAKYEKARPYSSFISLIISHHSSREQYLKKPKLAGLGLFHSRTCYICNYNVLYYGKFVFVKFENRASLDTCFSVFFFFVPSI